MKVKLINSFESLTEAIIETAAENKNFSNQGFEKLKKIFKIPIKRFLMESFSNQLFAPLNQGIISPNALEHYDNILSLMKYYGHILEEFLKLYGFTKNSKTLLNRNGIKTLNVDGILWNSHETRTEFINFSQDRLADLSAILSYNKDQFIKFLLIENESLTAEDFAKIFETNISENRKVDFIKELLTKNKPLKEEHFLKIAEVIKNLSAERQEDLAESYLETMDLNSVDTAKIFVRILKLTTQLNQESQANLRMKYLINLIEALESLQEHSRYFIKILDILAKDSDLDQELLIDLVTKYLINWVVYPESFIKILNIVAEYLGNEGQYKIIDTYLDMVEEEELTVEELTEILNLATALDEDNQSRLIAKYSNKFLKNIKLEDIFTICNNTLLVFSDLTIKFDAEMVAITYLNILSRPNIKPISEKINHLEWLITLATQLHSENEESQFDILLEALEADEDGTIKKDHLFSETKLQNLTDIDKQGGSSKQKNSSALINKRFLKYINEAQSDNLVMKLITALQEKNLLENEERTLLYLVKGRAASRFKFIKELFEEKEVKNSEDVKGKGKEVERKKLSKFFTKEGFKTLKDMFGKDYLKENDIGILDIISYYDATNQITSVAKILNPDFKKTLSKSLKTSKGDFLIKPEEVTKLSQITDIPLEKIKKKLISNEVLCEYFLKKVSGNLSGPDPFRDLSDEEKAVYQINFTGFIPDVKEKEQEQRLQDINRKFKEILTSENLMEGDVVEFFRLTMGNNLAINQTNSAKLFDFFKKSKNELAYLLSQPEGISKIAETIHSLGDGCSANIGTHFTMAFYSSLFKTQEDGVLYMILTQNIIPEILNKHGGDVIGNNPNPLNNKIIRSYFISPEILFDKICDALIGKQEIKSYEFIKNFLQKEMKFNDNKVDTVRFGLLETFGDDNDKVKEIVAYLILSKTIGKKETFKVGDRVAKARENFNAANDRQDSEKELRKFSDRIKKRIKEESFSEESTKAQSFEKAAPLISPKNSKKHSGSLKTLLTESQPSTSPKNNDAESSAESSEKQQFPSL